MIPLLLFLLFPLADSGYAQNREAYYTVPRIDRIRFDGMPDEAAWEAIEPVPLVQYTPNAGAPPTEKTEIRIAHDDDYFYASLRGYDSNPDGIRGNSLYRDRLAGSDHFEILLDTYNDNETAYIFTTTPTGIRNDVAISNDATGGSITSGGWLNRDFNTFWDAKTTVTDEGWFAEIRIPFSSLRFQTNDGTAVMGLTLQRKIARKTERLVYPAIPPESDFAFLRPSKAKKIRIEGIDSPNRLYITPYALGGLQQQNELRTDNSGFDRTSDGRWDFGGDFKMSLTNYLTLDLTANTDFAQVEADDQQVNLTRFSLFFPEKRQFFQERASLFEFRTGGLSRLFYSRRIGLSAGGELIPIYGGARLTGRLGAWDLGVLNMQTAEEGALPSENFGVVRLRRRIINENSYLGGMATSRIGADGGYNLGYGLDGLIRLFGDDYLSVKFAQTFDDEPIGGEPIRGINSARITAELQRRRRQGLGYDAGFIWSGINYNPGIGFVQRSDFKHLTGELNHTWLYDTGPFIWHQIGATGFTYIRNADQSIQSAEYGPEWNYNTRGSASGTIEFKISYEDLAEVFELSDNAFVPIENYTFYRVGASYRMATERLLRTGLRVEAGSFYDGTRYSAVLSPSWYVSKHLELSSEYQYERIRFEERNQQFDAHILRVRIGTALDNKLSANSLIQYNNTLDLLSANVRFRYNFREGQDLWIVYNEGLNTSPYKTDPHLPVSDSRTILIKFTYTFKS
ncbi:MAG: DUF5916 domain-containing protein [Balneolaceae bacterium]|nr:DUF5916 domain-containing protein [Balneolaceae bacterium]